MKQLLPLFLLLATPLLAMDAFISEEQKTEEAEWIGTGILGPKFFVGELDGEYLWKSTLTVAETLKGKPQKSLEFHYEQGHAPGERLSRYRCPVYPKVPDAQKVRVYLQRRKMDGKEVYFLNSNQLIQSLPDKTK